MVKVKMLARFGSATGRKFEKGLVYSLPPAYAEEVIRHGLAERMAEPEPEIEPVIVEQIIQPEEPLEPDSGPTLYVKVEPEIEAEAETKATAETVKAKTKAAGKAKK